MQVSILSGPSGSGKSHHVQEMVKAYLADGQTGRVFSADHYFHGVRERYRGVDFSRIATRHRPEVYHFEPELIAAAHAQCGLAFVQALIGTNLDHLIVDNTNIWIGEKAPYYAAAQWFAADVEIIRLNTPLHICIERNIHDVPIELIEAMWHNHNARNDRGFFRETLPWWKEIRV